jgi:hypothetical protein
MSQAGECTARGAVSLRDRGPVGPGKEFQSQKYVHDSRYRDRCLLNDSFALSDGVIVRYTVRGRYMLAGAPSQIDRLDRFS